MKKFLLIALLSILSFSAFARTAWVDNKAICEKTGGNWRLFNNDCGNSCSSKFDLPICASMPNYSCDCGKNRCWDGDKCASDKVAKKFWDKIAKKNQAERSKQLEELKAAQDLFYRQTQAIEAAKMQANQNATNSAVSPQTIAAPIDPNVPASTIDPEAERANNEKKLFCEQRSGVWKEFGNGCVDNCVNKASRMSMCTSAITMGCECGETKCWDNNQSACVEIEDYKKLMASPIVINPTSPPSPLPATSPIEINATPKSVNSQPIDQKSNNSSTQPITKK